MLTVEGCSARRRRLWQAVPSESVDWLMITDPRHVHYLCNFWVNPLSFSAGDNGILVLNREGDDWLFADNFVRRSSTSPHAVVEVIDDWYDHRHSVIDRNHAIARVMRGVAAELSTRQGYIERCPAQMAGVGTRNGKPAAAGGYDLGHALRLLRRQKELDEVELLRLCMAAGDAGHHRAQEIMQPGLTEFDVFRAVQEAATSAAGRPVVVYGDFRATNADAPKAGGLPTHYELQPGDLFILDYSVVIDGYRSDSTNTYAVGTATDEQVRMARSCIAAISAGEALLKSRTTAAAVFAALSGMLEGDGLGPLRHHAGHGLGLSHPEPPILVSESDDSLMAGDVITLEPGAYVKGVGGMRFEHNYLITETGFERLSNHRLGL